MNSQIPVFLHFEGSTTANYPWKPRIYFRSGIIDGVPWKYCQIFQIIRKDWKSGVHPWEQSRDPLSRGKVHYPQGSQGWIPSALIFLALSFQAWREWQALEAARNSLRNIPAKFKAPFPTRGLFPITFLEAGFTSDSSSSGGSLSKGEQREFSQIPAITCSSKEEICHLFILSTSSRQLASRTSSSVTSWQDNAGGGNAGVSGGGRNG